MYPTTLLKCGSRSMSSCSVGAAAPLTGIELAVYDILREEFEAKLQGLGVKAVCKLPNKENLIGRVPLQNRANYPALGRPKIAPTCRKYTLAISCR